AVAVVDHVLDAAHVDPGLLRDRLDRLDHPVRRPKPLDPQAAVGGAGGAGAPHQFGAVRALAGVGRAEVEGVAGREHLNGVEVLAAERLDAGDVPATGRYELLHQRGVVDAEDEAILRGGAGQVFGPVEADDAGPRAADV